MPSTKKNRVSSLLSRISRVFDNDYNIQKPTARRNPVIGQNETRESIKIASGMPNSVLDNINTIVTVPKFYTYSLFYEMFPEVSTPINRSASRISSLSGRLYTDGYVEEKVTKDFIKDYRIKDLIREIAMNMQLHGQCIIAEFNTTDKAQRFQVIPPQEVTLWSVKQFNISEFTWRSEIGSLRITEDFYISRQASLKSKWFGESPFVSFYDRLDGLGMDIDNFNEFLRNNSFPGLAFIPKEGISDEEFDVLRQSIEKLNQKGARFKAGVYDTIDRIEHIKQDLQFKMAPEEKNEIAMMAAAAVSYPYQFLKKGSSGLGQGEQKSVLQVYKDELTDPVQSHINSIVNDFILPRCETKYKKFTWKSTPMSVSSLEDMANMVFKGVDSGVFSVYEGKTRYLGYEDDEVQEDDKFRIVGSNVVKEGEIESGNMQTNVLRYEMPGKATAPSNESKEMVQPEQNPLQKVKESIESQKTLNGNDKRRLRKMIETISQEIDDGYSPIELLTATVTAVELADLIRKGLEEQSIRIIDQFDVKSMDSVDNIVIDDSDRLLSFIEPGLLVYYINYFMTLSKLEAYRELEKLGIVLTPEIKAEINREIQDYANSRVESLMGDTELLDDQVVDINDISQPAVPESLDITTGLLIAGIIAVSPNKATAVDIAKKRAKTRADRILETEISRAYNASLFIISKKNDTVELQWLRTRSDAPRRIHLELVGQRGNTPDDFDGEWPGVRIQCKCSLKFVIKN